MDCFRLDIVVCPRQFIQPPSLDAWMIVVNHLGTERV